MSTTQVDRPVSRKAQVIGVTAVVAVIAAAGAGIGINVHAAQVQAAALHAMTAAAPVYQDTITFGGSLDTLNTQSVQAKAAYDQEQARIAAQKAAEAAAAAAAAQAEALAAQQAAQAAAEQQAAQEVAAQQSDAPSEDPAPADDVPYIPDPGSSDGGRYDTSGCGSAGATTNPDGSVTCAG